ncbi:hypothetical protein CLF_111133 [Clonorchis sinensis]|uniref:Uncharacterized protein n=1 Tax=Clonorchis sinensis TaxID=79923 RepID=G7YUE9_CLOSI|nr:hypothetical protein CLF_111133 [Clonorchis sinensis]
MLADQLIDLVDEFVHLGSSKRPVGLVGGGMDSRIRKARWVRHSRYRDTCGSFDNCTTSTRCLLIVVDSLPLGQPGSIPAIVQLSGGMAVRHRKGATAERYLSASPARTLPGSPPLSTLRAHQANFAKTQTTGTKKLGIPIYFDHEAATLSINKWNTKTDIDFMLVFTVCFSFLREARWNPDAEVKEQIASCWYGLSGSNKIRRVKCGTSGFALSGLRSTTEVESCIRVSETQHTSIEREIVRANATSEIRRGFHNFQYSWIHSGMFNDRTSRSMTLHFVGAMHVDDLVPFRCLAAKSPEGNTRIDSARLSKPREERSRRRGRVRNADLLIILSDLAPRPYFEWHRKAVIAVRLLLLHERWVSVCPQPVFCFFNVFQLMPHTDRRSFRSADSILAFLDAYLDVNCCVVMLNRCFTMTLLNNLLFNSQPTAFFKSKVSSELQKSIAIFESGNTSQPATQNGPAKPVSWLCAPSQYLYFNSSESTAYSCEMKIRPVEHLKQEDSRVLAIGSTTVHYGNPPDLERDRRLRRRLLPERVHTEHFFSRFLCSALSVSSCFVILGKHEGRDTAHTCPSLDKSSCDIPVLGSNHGRFGQLHYVIIVIIITGFRTELGLGQCLRRELIHQEPKYMQTVTRIMLNDVGYVTHRIRIFDKQHNRQDDTFVYRIPFTGGFSVVSLLLRYLSPKSEVFCQRTHHLPRVIATMVSLNNNISLLLNLACLCLDSTDLCESELITLLSFTTSLLYLCKFSFRLLSNIQKSKTYFHITNTKEPIQRSDVQCPYSLSNS